MTLGVNLEIREGEFEAAEAPADLSLAPLVPVQNMVGWWLFLAFAVLLVVVAIVTYTH
jgi:hypothetical protein